jgi:dTDP-4-dehydrorhamnose 3,5-epimerase
MKVVQTDLPGVLLIEPAVYGDERGFFLETWSAARSASQGLPTSFVQDNLSRSSRGVLRGLHLQNPNSQGKLIHVLEGEVFDVAVDVRRGSPDFGRWVGFNLSGENHRQVYVPEGFAHGFCVLSETALFAYKCTDVYNPNAELSVLWNDPAIGIEWPIAEPLLSSKDRNGMPLREIPAERLPSLEQCHA